MNKAIPWIIFIVAVIAVISGVIYVAKKSPRTLTGQTYPITVAADDWAVGPADAPLTLVEYSDFQCPACAAYYTLVKQLQAEYASSTRFVYRNYPLEQHKNAKLAAYVAGAAGLQGKFFEMHDVIFANQSEWSEATTTEALLLSYAQTIGLDLTRLSADIVSSTVQDKVQRDIESGNAYGVNATPSFYLNGKKLQNPQGYDAFKKILDAELRS